MLYWELEPFDRACNLRERRHVDRAPSADAARRGAQAPQIGTTQRATELVAFVSSTLISKKDAFHLHECNS